MTLECAVTVTRLWQLKTLTLYLKCWL